MIITIIEAADKTVQSLKSLPLITGIAWVASFKSGELMRTKAKKKSFHTQTNCSAVREARAGKVNGKTIL